MIALTSNATITLLAGRWRQWRKIIRAFVRRRAVRRSIDPVYYHILHQEILALTRNAQSIADPRLGPLSAELLELLAPWVTLDSLHWADRGLLAQVLADADRLQGAIEGRSVQSVLRRERLLPALALALAVAIALTLLIYRGRPLARQLGWDEVQEYYDLGRSTVSYYGHSGMVWLLGLEGLLFLPLLWFWRWR